MKLALVAAVMLLAVPCLAAEAPPAASSDDVFAGLALVCKGDARDNGSCTIIKIEPPAGLSKAKCTEAWSHLNLVPGATVLGARCLTLREVEGLLPHIDAAPQADAPQAAPAPDAAPPVDAQPPQDDDTIHGSTDGWRKV